MRATAAFSLRYQLDAALHMPRMASVAMRGSRSARNSPFATPSLMTSSKMRSSPRDHAADAPTALARQILAFVEEDLDEVDAVDERGQVRIN